VAAELALPPNLLSLARLPLAALFPLVASSPVGAVIVLLCAGVTDVLDGWAARRWGMTTVTGAILDPISDKLFAIAVLATLITHATLPLWALAPLLAREIIEAPLVIWIASSRQVRRRRATRARANVPGKLATAVQYAAVLSAIAWPDGLRALVVAAGVTGLAAGVGYWARELSSRPAPPGAPGRDRSERPLV
jgi:CDP-diacylglycerol--glycerol-3-phosphate 3-phosphatidyltransferase/cardiolipin synthase